MLKLDADRSGSLSPSERSKLLNTIGKAPQKDLNPDYPSTFIGILPAPRHGLYPSQTFPQANLQPPNATRYFHSSKDGYAYLNLDSNHKRLPSYPEALDDLPTFNTSENLNLLNPMYATLCKFYTRECFDEDFLDLENEVEVDTVQFWQRITYEVPQCGDCLSLALLHESGKKGFEAFLPLATLKDGKEQKEEMRLETPKSWRQSQSSFPDRTLATRIDVISLLLRYSYVIGGTESQFISMKFIGTFRMLLGRVKGLINIGKGPVFLTINDDIPKNVPMRGFDDMFQKWMEDIWPEKREWEL